MRCCVLASLAVIASLFILLSGHVQHALATGETVIVQINGPTEHPSFSPALLTIHLYDTVMFVNQSTTSYAIAADDNNFSSPAIAHNQQWTTTFSILGAHSYHATSTTSNYVSMIGEILVVAENVVLLPTPQPQIEATALALIQAGKHPPDSIQLPTTTTPVVRQNIQTPPSLQARLLSLPVLASAGGILVLLIGIIIVLSRRRQRIKYDEDFLDDELFPYSMNTRQRVIKVTSGATATLITPDAQPVQVPKRNNVIQLFQTMGTRLHRGKKDRNDEGDEENEDDEDEK